jgi:protein-tyrosine phosphatase
MNTVLKTERSSTRQVLFLDVENKYRSRFAEEYFNSYAIRYGLKVIASSRGVNKNIESEERTLTEYTTSELQKRGLYPMQSDRKARCLDNEEAKTYDHIIAMDADELEPLLQKNYPEIASNVTYWNVKNLVNGNMSSELDKLSRLLDDMLV